MTKTISTVAFTALAVTSIFTTSNVAVLATNGATFFILLLIAIFFFFIPSALVVGKLATGPWGTNIFSWVDAAYGKRVGLAAVFWQWFQAIVMTLPILYFTVGTFAYSIGIKELDTNPVYQLLLAVGFYILLITIEIKKPRFLIRLEAFGFWICIMIPIVIIFTLSTMYILDGHAPAFPFTVDAFVPSFDLKNGLALIPYVSSLAGIEISGPFVNRLGNIKKDYPKAIFIVVIIAFIANLIGSGAIAVILPPDKITLSSGFIQVYIFLFDYFNIPIFLVRIIGIAVVIGMLIKTSNWQLSPALALQSSTSTGLLPKKFSYVNSNGTPTFILLVQLSAFTVLGVLLALSRTGNIAFLSAVYLDVAIYTCMYVLLFMTYFKIKKTQQKVSTYFEIPKSLRTVAPLIGLLTSVAIVILCFFPPGQVPKDQYVLYLSILMISFVCAFIAPFLLGYFYSKKEKVS